MPARVKDKIYAKLYSALLGADDAGNHLPAAERREIVQILTETLPDLPSAWK